MSRVVADVADQRDVWLKGELLRVTGDGNYF